MWLLVIEAALNDSTAGTGQWQHHRPPDKQIPRWCQVPISKWYIRKRENHKATRYKLETLEQVCIIDLHKMPEKVKHILNQMVVNDGDDLSSWYKVTNILSQIQVIYFQT